MDPLNRLLAAKTKEEFAQLAAEMVPLQPLFQAEVFQPDKTTAVPQWIKAWPKPMQTVFLCPEWNAWMLEQIQQWKAKGKVNEAQIPVVMTNLVKATVFYLISDRQKNSGWS